MKQILLFLSFCLIACSQSTGLDSHPSHDATKPVLDEIKNSDSIRPADEDEVSDEGFYATRSIFNNKVQLLIPASFTIMDERIISKKYPGENHRPTLVFTNVKASVTVAFSHDTSLPTIEEDMSQVKDFYDGQLSQQNFSFYKSSMQKINGRNIVVFEFISKAVDKDIYNIMFFSHLEGSLFVGTFNCTVPLKEEWEQRGKQILASLKFIE